MKQLYKYYADFDCEDNLLWYVYELSSDQLIAEFFFEDDAKKLCEFLEKGGGFNGFTPSFILSKVKMPNINDAFNMQFSE